MRIAIASEVLFPKRDGVTLDLDKLICHLKSQRHDVLLFGPIYSVPSHRGFPVCRAVGFPVGLYPGLHASVVLPHAYVRLVNFNPDVIFAVDPFYVGTQILAFARAFLPHVALVLGYNTNVPYYTAVFGYPHISPVHDQLLRWQGTASRLIACRSSSSTVKLTSEGWDAASFRVWPGGIDANRFHPSKGSESLRREWSRDGTRTVLLYVGRVSWEKNLEALLDAYLPLEEDKFHLVVVGDGPAVGEFKALLGDKLVTFTGWRAGEDLAEVYASADMFVYPSTSETFGNVVAEAMASGLPVVAFDSEGVKDSVVDGITGLLVEENDVSALSDAVRKLATDKNLMDEMGREGRQRVQSWTVDRSVRGCEWILVEAVALSRKTGQDGLGDRLFQAIVMLALCMLQSIIGFWSGMYRFCRYGQIRANPTRERLLRQKRKIAAAKAQGRLARNARRF